MYITKLLSLVTMFIFFAGPVWAEQGITVYGQVTQVLDGDTVMVKAKGGHELKIRLYGIDAPELGQAFGKAARRHLRELTDDKNLKITLLETDRYGRLVAVLSDKEEDLNQKMATDGYAWHFIKYCKLPLCQGYKTAQEQAQAGQKGLWADHEPKAPWDFRSEKK